MEKHQLKQLKDDLQRAIQPILDRHGIDSTLTTKLQYSRFGKVTFAFEASTREGAKIRLNGWRFLLTDDVKELDIRQPFIFNKSIYTLVDIDPRKMEGAPWIVEDEQGNRTYMTTGVPRDCLIAAEERVYVPRASRAKTAVNYATWG